MNKINFLLNFLLIKMFAICIFAIYFYSNKNIFLFFVTIAVFFIVYFVWLFIIFKFDM
jgi:hypothetical protein